MFDYSKKTFLDIISELFSKIWFRFVFGWLFSICSFIFVEYIFSYLSDGLILTCMFIAIQGMLTALSIFNNEKYKYIGNYILTTNKNEKIHYAIVRKTVNCHFIFPPFNLMSLSFYIPHEVKYYLVRDAGNIENKYTEEKISPFFLINIQETIRIKSKDLEKVKENSPVYIAELNRRTTEAKTNFEQHIKKFLENGLLTIEYESYSFSVFGLPFSSDKICTFYTKLEDKEKGIVKHLGFIVGENFAEKVKENPSKLFLGYSFHNDCEKLLNQIVAFDDEYFNYLKDKKEWKEKIQPKAESVPADFEFH